ncbi:MAG: ArsR family transcriptional regulator [Azonexus sp.]|jgi:hypothetical protein|nr:ArsR family transcriptional regulator [Azonexus sp.]
MNYAEILREDTRLMLLRLIDEISDRRRGNSAQLTDLHNRLTTKPIAHDEIKTELRWLAERQLLEIDEAGSVLMVTLTERGHEVATGAAAMAGVARYAPWGGV